MSFRAGLADSISDSQYPKASHSIKSKAILQRVRLHLWLNCISVSLTLILIAPTRIPPDQVKFLFHMIGLVYLKQTYLEFLTFLGLNFKDSQQAE